MKTNKTLPIFVALLTLTSIVPMALAAGQGMPNLPNLPDELPMGMGDGQMGRVNLTDVIPANYRHNMTAGNATLLRFQNMVMELNCSRNMTMNITSEDGVRIQYLALHIETERNMHLEMHARAEPPVDIPGPAFGINQYMEFETNNTGPMNVSLRFYMNATDLELTMNRELNMSRMTWCYWNGTDWEPVRSMLTESGFLEANTTHFSLWTIMEHLTAGQPEVVPGEKVKIQNLKFPDVVPQNFKHTAESHQATMLQFKNTSLYINCTNQLKLQVSAENQYTQNTLRLEVNPGSSLSLQINMRNTKPSQVSVPDKSLGFYCEIEPNRTITQAKIGMEIDPSKVQAMNMEMEKLTWAYWDGTKWQPVDSTLTNENILEADTDHFSTWTILQVEEPSTTEPEPTQTTTGIPAPTIFIVTGITLFAIIVRGSKKEISL